MMKNDEPGCVQKDDASLIIEKMISADAIVMASPIYSFFFSAQLKSLIDRSFCLLNTSLMKKKPIAVLTTCAGQAEGNTELTKGFCERAFNGENSKFGSEFLGEFDIPLSNGQDFEERCKKTADKMLEAFSF